MKKGYRNFMIGLAICLIVVFILTVFTGMFSSPWRTTPPIPCANNPINGFVVTIQKAETGIDVLTDTICMDAGEAFSSSAFVGTKISNLKSLTFSCDDSAICSSQNPLLVVSNNQVAAEGSAKFTALISCTLIGNTSTYDCEAKIRSA